MVCENAKWVKDKDKWLSFVLNIVWYLLEEMMIIKEIEAEIVIKTEMHLIVVTNTDVKVIYTYNEVYLFVIFKFSFKFLNLNNLLKN